MSHAASPQNRSRVPWALALVVGLCSALAGYVIHAARVNRIPKEVVTVKRLTDMPGVEELPAISPDGTQVAFVAAVGDKKQVWIEKPVTKDDADHLSPRWTPDSKSLIYFANNAIWEIAASGGEARKLADAMAPGDLSHNGKLAFFRRDDRGVELIADSRTVATLASGGTYSNLRWSPDDKTIAYLQDGKVMAIGVSGGDPVEATKGFTVQGFTWTPDNTGMIVSTGGELWFVPRAENRTPSQLTFGELSYQFPDVSADGRVVVSRSGLGADADIVMFSGLKW
jgi:Tol biopolymer transport system component